MDIVKVTVLSKHPYYSSLRRLSIDLTQSIWTDILKLLYYKLNTRKIKHSPEKVKKPIVVKNKK